jgi:dCMP deaminase
MPNITDILSIATRVIKSPVVKKFMSKLKLVGRPEWDDVWMQTTHLIGQRSYDPRHRVGVVIVTEDNTQVLAVGYNGNYTGGPNEVESLEPGQSGFIHAEINALLKMDYNNPKRKILYVTLSPCKMCAKAIVNAGIDEVVFDQEYRDTSGLNILNDAGVQIRRCRMSDE